MLLQNKFSDDSGATEYNATDGEVDYQLNTTLVISAQMKDYCHVQLQKIKYEKTVEV